MTVKIKTLKHKNGCSLIQYPSGMYGVEYSDSSIGYGMKYTDSKESAERFFNKVSADTCPNGLEAIRKQQKQFGNNSKKNFRIVCY